MDWLIDLFIDRLTDQLIGQLLNETANWHFLDWFIHALSDWTIGTGIFQNHEPALKSLEMQHAWEAQQN